MPLSRQIVGQVARTSRTTRPAFLTITPSSRCYSADVKKDFHKTLERPADVPAKSSQPPQEKPKKKTQMELDKELEMKMSGIAGDGGEAGVELEDGQPVAMKRSVRNNMFRYI